MKRLLIIARVAVFLLLLVYVGELLLQRALADAIANFDAAPTRQPEPGTYEVNSLLATWHDDKRDRDVPVKIYWPGELRERDGAAHKEADANSTLSSVGKAKGDVHAKPLPLLLFSHGLGGSREMYTYLGNCWAGEGFIVVHVQHHGSDDALWRDNKRPMLALKAATLSMENASNRPLDISFAIDQMLALNMQKDSPFFGKVDDARIGVAGHSFGAYTVLALAGQGSNAQSAIARQFNARLREPRIKAAIAMSAPVNLKAAQRGGHYDAIDLPLFHMTGTRDNSFVGEASAKDRRIPFDQIQKNDGYLMTFTDGDHMVFSGRRRNTRQSPTNDPEAIVPAKPDSGSAIGNPGSARTIFERDAAEHALIEQSSLAFWRAYLLDDAAAKAWLQGEGFKKALGDEGTFEMKLNKGK